MSAPGNRGALYLIRLAQAWYTTGFAVPAAMY